MIPRLIHQTYISRSRIPSNWETARQSVIKNHPDYSYVFWTDDDIHSFMRKEYPTAYHSFFVNYPHKIQQIDAFRYFVLYHYGGIYMDLDIGVNASMDKYLEHDLVLLRSYANSSYFTNALMMSSPRNAFMRQCMDALHSHQGRYRHLGKHLHVMNSTGPLFLSKQLNRYTDMYYTISSEDFGGDCNLCNLEKCTGGRIFFQVQGSSWHSLDSTIFNYLFCHGFTCVLILLLFILLTKYKYKFIMSLLLYICIVIGIHNYKRYTASYFKTCLFNAHLDREYGKSSDTNTHHELYKLLRSFMHVCETHDIRPVLMYGGLLGWKLKDALLPWDDDIDMIVLEEDHEKLVALDGRETPDWIFKVNPRYSNRVVNDPYNVIEARMISKRSGVFIDLMFHWRTPVATFRAKDSNEYPVDDVLPLRRVTFHGIPVYVPNKVDAVLVQRYGTKVLQPYEWHEKYHGSAKFISRLMYMNMNELKNELTGHVYLIPLILKLFLL
jgi:mannosyltransferase OCH1-like enzyme